MKEDSDTDDDLFADEPKSFLPYLDPNRYTLEIIHDQVIQYVINLFKDAERAYPLTGILIDKRFFDLVKKGKESRTPNEELIVTRWTITHHLATESQICGTTDVKRGRCIDFDKPPYARVIRFIKALKL